MLVSVYIRKEDEELWRKLPKKTETISRMLRGQNLAEARIKETIEDDFKYGNGSGKPTEYVKVSEHVVKNPKLCKHGSPKGECFHKEATRLRCNIV